MENRLIFDSHPLFDSHPSIDITEEYAFNRLSEAACAEFEEHLLVCPRCQYNLTRTDEYILLMKQATAQWRSAAPAKAPQTALWRSSMAAVLGAALVTAALAVGLPHMRPARPASSVELVAMRGGGGPAMARARAGAPIDIAIDATDLDHPSHLRIQVVDAGGRPVWSGPASESSARNRVSAQIDARLSAGIYWVRLYSAAGELLREFGLRVQ